MRLEVAGVQYSDFVESSVTFRLDALSDSFSFSAVGQDGVPLPFQGGESCRVFVDGEKSLTGFIDLVNVEGDATSHSIDVQGRDKMGDVVDSTLGVIDDIRAPLTMRRVCQLVLRHLGVSASVVDLANPRPFNSSEDLAAPESGVGAFEFLEKLARKRQVLLTSDADGNLVITNSSGQGSGGRVHHRVRDNENNVLGYSVSYDRTGRFNLYQSVSQLNAIPAALAGALQAESIVSQGANKQIRDRAIRAGRQMILVSESMFSSSEDQERAKWERDIRRARGRVYSPKLSGFRNQEGNLWRVNELVQVVDEYAGINDRMLVNSVTFTQSLDEGRTTTLSLIERDAYTLSQAEPQNQEIGLGFDLDLPED